MRDSVITTETPLYRHSSCLAALHSKQTQWVLVDEGTPNKNCSGAETWTERCFAEVTVQNARELQRYWEVKQQFLDQYETMVRQIKTMESHQSLINSWETTT